jgi:two-component system sensor histidine kinase PilS (NtrC family)
MMTAQIDSDQMKQVFWNLATNAFEAMSSGGQLTISTSRRRIGSGERSGEVIEVLFQDTGEGIQKEALDKIFLPFFTTKKRGSGLGLAAVHRIVDLHGGWIRVESHEGKGSQFSVCLPVSADAGLRLWHEGREPWKRY